MLPTAIGTPMTEIGSPPTKMYNAPAGYRQASTPADDERGAERQQEAQERPLFAVLAIDRPHQREVEQDGDARQPPARPGAAARTVETPSSMRSEMTIAASTTIWPYARLRTPPRP